MWSGERTRVWFSPLSLFTLADSRCQRLELKGFRKVCGIKLLFLLLSFCCIWKTRKTRKFWWDFCPGTVLCVASLINKIRDKEDKSQSRSQKIKFSASHLERRHLVRLPFALLIWDFYGRSARLSFAFDVFHSTHLNYEHNDWFSFPSKIFLHTYCNFPREQDKINNFLN